MTAAKSCNFQIQFFQERAVGYVYVMKFVKVRKVFFSTNVRHTFCTCLTTITIVSCHFKIGENSRI